MAVWLVVWLVLWLAVWLVVWLVLWLAVWLVGCLVGSVVGSSVGWSVRDAFTFLTFYGQSVYGQSVYGHHCPSLTARDSALSPALLTVAKKKVDASFNVCCAPNDKDLKKTISDPKTIIQKLTSEFLRSSVDLLVEEKCEKNECSSNSVKSRTKSVGVIFVMV